MTRGGGGVQTPPKKDDIIYEQPLIDCIILGANSVKCIGMQCSILKYIVVYGSKMHCSVMHFTALQ